MPVAHHRCLGNSEGEENTDRIEGNQMAGIAIVEIDQQAGTEAEQNNAVGKTQPSRARIDSKGGSPLKEVLAARYRINMVVICI